MLPLSFFLLKKMTEIKQQKTDLQCFEKYSNFHLVDEYELKLAINYIRGNLNANYTMNYPYWYDMYNYTTKNLMVLRKRKEKNENLLTSLGECVCQDNIINFLNNTDKECLCDKRCESVYYNVVF